MNSYIKNLVFIFTIVFIVGLFLIYFILFGQNTEKLLQKDKDNTTDSGNLGSIKQGGNVNNNDSSYVGDVIGNGEPNAAGGSGGGGGGGGSSQGNSEGTGEETSGNEEIEVEQPSEKFCLVARPGNIEGIKCTVNFIQKESVSLKIVNNATEDISVNMILEGCSNEAMGTVNSGGEADFVFSCNADNYFEESLGVIYTISGNVIHVNGIVSGPVS